MSIDYGTKRTGIAVTDPLQIIAQVLTTIPTAEMFDYLTEYFQTEEVKKIVVGDPLHIYGNPTKITHLVKGFVNKLRKLFPAIEVVMHDERFSSVDAKTIILQSGAKQKKRRDKALVDTVSAALILEEYLKSTGTY